MAQIDIFRRQEITNIVNPIGTVFWPSFFACATLRAHFEEEPKAGHDVSCPYDREKKPRAGLKPGLYMGELDADTRRCLETCLRVHSFGKLA
jgi:hypothetical protein